MDTSVLEEAGLTEGETKVYLALLELGSSTTGPIVERSGIAKSIVYQILDKLMQKGMASVIVKEKTKYFQPAQPQRIVDYIGEQEKSLEETKKKVEELLPKLAGMQKTAKGAEATLFMGFRGMISVHERTYDKLRRGGEYYCIGIPSDQPRFFHSYYQRDHARRVKAGINCKLLFNPKTPPEILKNRNSFKGCDARYMPIEISSPVWILGYKGVVSVTMVSSNPITVEIVNQEIADSFRAYFEEFWKKSRQFK